MRSLNKAIIYDGVSFEGDYSLGAFVIIGEPSQGHNSLDLLTSIGLGACIRSHSVIYQGNKIGKHFQTGHGVLIREENQIGDNVSIGSGSIVEHHVEIGSGVRLHSNVFVPEFSVLEEDCWLGPNVVLTNAKYPKSSGVKKELKGPCVGKGAKIGANVTILPAVRIGINALVGAGSVVTSDVASGAVVAGNPARVIKQIKDLPY